MRTHAQEEGLLEAGVWPAVADMLLLLASIFILATVAAAATASPSQGDAGRDRLLAVTYHIPEGLLFPSGKAALIDPAAAEQVVRSVMEDAPGRIQSLREVASRAWPSYYVVIEAAGHTDFDALPSRALEGADGNWELSAQRASMVVHLVEQAARDPRLREALGIRGVPPYLQAPPGSTVLRAAGYASHLAAVDYAESSLTLDKQRNRRVEIRLFAQPAPVVAR